jgi:AcrR family transcriptional regulator
MASQKTRGQLAHCRGGGRAVAEYGYARAKVNQIAKRSGMAASNVYVYFKSKLEIMLAGYEPWLREQNERLPRDVARMRSPAAGDFGHDR